MSVLGDIRRFLWRGLEALIPILLWPINRILAVCLRYRYRRGSVLHVCYPVHIVYYTVQLLRAEGGDADYLAIGSSRDWELCDHRFERWRAWMPLALTEFYFFWTVMARYHILHLHFMQGISRTGWEWSVLKLLGRRIVVYYSGCEIRDRDLNAELHPGMNICEECDYASELCSGKISRRRRKLSARYADLELITTPDMRDFVPQGIHFPFFCPPDDIIPPRTRPYWPENKVFRVVHVTNHPGIEGTAAIAAACEMVRAQGHAVEFRHLLRTPYGQVLQEMADADLSIGKMKMGYYANAQIEALSCGTPCISHVRAGLITDALRASPLILTNLADLESEIGRLVKNPGLLAVYRAQARSGIGALHDNRTLSRRLLRMYQLLAQGRSHAEIASIVPDGLVDPAESGDYTRE